MLIEIALRHLVISMIAACSTSRCLNKPVRQRLLIAESRLNYFRKLKLSS
jgi:hypothetical protein